MNKKIIFSSIILMVFAILGGGSIENGAFKSIFWVIVIGIVILIPIAIIYENSKRKESAEKTMSLINSAPDFNATRKIPISEDLGLLIDDSTKKICILCPHFKKVISFDQVIDVEYIVNEETIASKSTLNTIGRSIVGGVLAGGVGAIVGGLSGKTKIENKISKIAVKVLIRDLNIPDMNITFFDCKTLPDRKPVSRDSIFCENSILEAQDFVNTMSVIIDEGKRMAFTPPEQQQVQTQENLSVADEIRKLAALRDEGILTQEEFEKKKKTLLS